MRVGIVSTSRVIDLFWTGFSQMKGIEVSSICCRPQSEGKARRWAGEYGIPAVYTDYARFLAEGTFDFVYIGTVNDQHYPQARQALLAGRNVILEKPFTVTAAECEELIRLAQSRGCWLFEAITPLYGPGFAFLRRQLPAIGPVQSIVADFSHYSSRYARYLAHEMTTTFDPAHAGGALFDMNVYCLHVVTGLVGLPQGAVYRPNCGWNGIDTNGLALLQYPGFEAACLAAKDVTTTGGLLIQGRNGALAVEGDLNGCADAYAVLEGQRLEAPAPEKDRFALEFEAFDRIWHTGDRASHDRALAHTLDVMRLLDTLRASAGLA